MKTKLLFGVLLAVVHASSAAVGSPEAKSAPYDNPPRKVLVGSVCRPFNGEPEQRAALVEKAVAELAGLADKRYGGRRLDLVVLPEHCLGRPGRVAAEKTLPMDFVKKVIGGAAKRHGCYVAAGVFLMEVVGGKECPRNALALFDRKGELVGVYRKVHTACNWDDPETTLSESGIAPGGDFPVFETDFGKVGFLICWDMSYADGWAELKRKGAEIVGVSTMSPQVFRPSIFAHEHEYWVVTSSPRSQAAVISPIGFPLASVADGEVLLAEIDLSFVTLHWSATLKGGQKFKDAFGEDAVGGIYRREEDNGVFWSNRPDKTIGQMIRELNIRPRDDEALRAERVAKGNRVAEKGEFK